MRILITLLSLFVALSLGAYEYPVIGEIGDETAFVFAYGTPASLEDYDYPVNHNLLINKMLGEADMTALADVNGDGVVDIDDVNRIINIMLGNC